jgi:hypothetical protein
MPLAARTLRSDTPQNHDQLRVSGIVSWEQPAWEFWGILEPLATAQDEDEPMVPVQQIIDTLS